MHSAREFSPAKLNLFLAVTGPRPDGFHDLISVASPLQWGDELTAEPAADFSLVCDQPGVPRDGTNLILKAAAAYRAATGWAGGAKFTLTKRIPIGAGLGGGSSNAVAALRLLNRLADGRLDAAGLGILAADLGSDCSLFLFPGPVLMYGRGELAVDLPAEGAVRLRGRRVLLFKPDFAIATAWSYGRMRAAPKYYFPATKAEAHLAAWLGDSAAPAEALLANAMEGPAFAKFPALPVLLDRLRRDFGLAPRMSGSGSACFALLPETGGPTVPALTAAIRAAWGESALVVETRLG
jgi:4-diphosphocytidyl-2-C-methyl-D-erythritol kinase